MVPLIYRSYVTYSLFATPQEHLDQSCLSVLALGIESEHLYTFDDFLRL